MCILYRINGDIEEKSIQIFIFQDPCNTEQGLTNPHPSAANSHITASTEESARTAVTVTVPAFLTQKSVIVSCVACPTLPSPPRLAAAPELEAAPVVYAADTDTKAIAPSVSAEAAATLGVTVSFKKCLL